MSEWKDCTSYCKGEERIPQSWAMDLAGSRLVVTRTHGLDGWFINSELTGRRQLKSVYIQDAQWEAIAMMGKKLRAMLSELPTSAATSETEVK